MTTIEGRLAQARFNLRVAQRNLYDARQRRSPVALQITISQFYRCLDRVWELQCMVHGVFGGQR